MARAITPDAIAVGVNVLQNFALPLPAFIIETASALVSVVPGWTNSIRTVCVRALVPTERTRRVDRTRPVLRL